MSATQQILVGVCSKFGGPGDRGMTPTEGVALYEKKDADPYGLFLPGKVGIGRGLNPQTYYCAMRWDYNKCSKRVLRGMLIGLRSKWHPAWLWVHPADWGPNENTKRLIDLSSRAMAALAVMTDERVEVRWQKEGVDLPLL